MMLTETSAYGTQPKITPSRFQKKFLSLENMQVLLIGLSGVPIQKHLCSAR